MHEEEFWEELRRQSPGLRRLLDSLIDRDGDLVLAYDRADPDSCQRYDQALKVIADLHRAFGELDYMAMPIAEEGTLHIKENGRFEACGRTLTSSDLFEVLRPADEEWDMPALWLETSVEYKYGNYYLTNKDFRNVPLEDLPVRFRCMR